MQEGIIVVTA
jgi:hypothetical protein